MLSALQEDSVVLNYLQGDSVGLFLQGKSNVLVRQLETVVFHCKEI